MGRDKNFINHRGRVLVNAKWIEGGCRIGVHDPAKALGALILGIAERAFPVPSLKVITELRQITFEAAGELVVMGCNLVRTQPRTVMHASRERRSGRHSTYLSPWKFRVRSSRRGVIRHCEWVKRILNRHANAIIGAAYPKGVNCIRKYVRRR